MTTTKTIDLAPVLRAGHDTLAWFLSAVDAPTVKAARGRQAKTAALAAEFAARRPHLAKVERAFTTVARTLDAEVDAGRLPATSEPVELVRRLASMLTAFTDPTNPETTHV